MHNASVVTPLDIGSLDKNDFRPVSVLNCFLSAYRLSYSSQHVLIRLIDEWRQKLDSDHFVGAVDLSKAFHCIPHDLLSAELSAYGLSDKALA